MFEGQLLPYNCSSIRMEDDMDTKNTSQANSRPLYVSPKITVMDRDEVLQAFQMTAAEISAAGCWWTPACPVANPM